MRIHERHWSGDPARPALALHCSMGSSSYWGPIAARLDGMVDLYAFDAPGHGRSGPWQPGERAGAEFHTGVTWIAAPRIDRPMDLIGHSLGATVALRIAVGAPQSVRTLTLIEPVLFAAAPEFCDDPLFHEMDRLLAAGEDEAATRAFLAVWGDGDFDGQPAAQRKRMIGQVRLVADANATLREDRARILRAGGLESVTAPVSLIRGADSPPVIAAIEASLRARLPDVTEAVVPGAGHMVPITHPDEVAALIRATLERG